MYTRLFVCQAHISMWKYLIMACLHGFNDLKFLSFHFKTFKPRVTGNVLKSNCYLSLSDATSIIDSLWDLQFINLIDNLTEFNLIDNLIIN